ncbi:MAG: GNAT family N-acetyltransferase [Treponema sp.]|jgi:RimJ/RimL family protein N-acetyltransferase|nr:GNAT family N-acetyltransferase [Treponema sp.]
MYIKKLVGKKCYLSPIDINDAEKYATWLNDLEITQYLTLATSVVPVDGEREALQRLSKDHNYAIVDAATDKLLGNVGFIDVNHIHRTAEIGIFIGEKTCWNKGYGAEALSLLLDYAYKYLNLHSILLRTYSFNKRAIACYEKIGFQKIGEIRQGLVTNLQYHNIVLMDILPEDFYKE